MKDKSSTPVYSTLVYSTDGGRIKPRAEKPVDNGDKKYRDPDDGFVRIHRESKGRGGKGVCVITGLKLKADALNELAKKLKQACGTGGTVKDQVIEIQGDNREKLKVTLEKLGYNVKLAGG
jgi:translation initiation factor 1